MIKPRPDFDQQVAYIYPDGRTVMRSADVEQLEQRVVGIEKELDELRNSLESYVTKEAAHRERNATRQKAYRDRKRNA